LSWSLSCLGAVLHVLVGDLCGIVCQNDTYYDY
jgi:hypothetical protein